MFQSSLRLKAIHASANRLLGLPVLLVLLFVLLFIVRNEASEGVRAVDLSLKSLVYDPHTHKLYGTGTNDLLQIDPESGAILASFRLGINATLLSLGAENGLWVALDGEHAILRFNLETMTAAEKIPITPAPIFDLYASRIDASAVVFSTTTVHGIYSQFDLIRNGALLPPAPFQYGYNVGLQGNFAYNGGSRFTLGPGGFVSPPVAVGGSGRFLFAGNYIYRGDGTVLDARTLGNVAILPLGGNAFMAASEEPDVVYYLAATLNGLMLGRVDQPALGLKAAGELGTELGQATSLAAWGTNRVAFITESKLVLVETDKLFQPADLEVTQTAMRSLDFGSIAAFDVTIANKGPGVAVRAKATNLFSSGVGWLSSSPTSLHSSEAIPLEWGFITPESPVTLTVFVRPNQSGNLTNQWTVAAANDSNAVNNFSTIVSTITPATRPVSVFSFAPTFMTYDESRNRLYFVENLSLWSVDLDAPSLQGPVALPEDNYSHTVSALTGSGDGSIYLQRDFFGSEIMRVDPESLAVTPVVSAGNRPVDLKISPGHPTRLFISDERGSAIFEGNVGLPNYLSYSTVAQFSPDGNKLYTLDPNTCDLQTFTINQAGLTIEQSQPVGSCGAFQQVGGLLYFESGLIYDPVAGRKLTNSLNLPPSTLLVPRASVTIDLLSRTNDVWVVRRLAPGDHHEVKRIILGDLSPTPPVEAQAAGDNRIAFRTWNGLYFVDLDPALLIGSISVRTPGTASLEFNTAPGRRYRLEKTSQLPAAVWNVVRGNIDASSSVLEETVQLDKAGGAFFRLVLLP